MRPLTVLLAGFLSCAFPTAALAREPDVVFPVWPGPPPGQSQARGPEHRLEGRPRPFYQLTGIDQPTVGVFLPPEGRRNGTGILVCPGGGLQRLAYEHEGLEVADWLNSLDIAAFVLKYRVPAPATTAASDAQRALSLIRRRAVEWQVEPTSIGVLGFSAGGEIAAWLVTHANARLYEAIDSSDAVPCRPDFAALIYPGGLVDWRTGVLNESIAGGLDTHTPPLFFVHAFDDASDNSLRMALAVKKAGATAELHVYQEGGHGFGVRSTGVPVHHWKSDFKDWLANLGFLDAASIRQFVRQYREAAAGGTPAPHFMSLVPESTLDLAYAAQRRLVRAMSDGDRVAGFKGAAASEAAQASLGLDGPMAGVVFRSGWLDGTRHQVLDLQPGGGAIETEIGYLTSVDLSYEVLTDEQARGAVVAMVPIIELPRSLGMSPGPVGAADIVAADIGSARYIVGIPNRPVSLEPDAIPVSLRRDDQLLHQTTGASVRGGQWHNLRRVLNELTRHGYTIPAGSVILGGALGKIETAAAGRYEARYGELGTLTFDLR